MNTVQVELGARSYPILIGSALLAQPSLLAPFIKGRQVMVVSNTTVAPLYLASCMAQLSDFQAFSVILPDGEKYKNLTELNLIYDALLTRQCDRDTTLIALGGGVVGDMTGFAAATYQRGVHFVQIPTTLLAQVDSSVGGKTGVNHALGKNMLGAFYQPVCVLADTDTLNTLDDRQLACGFAEIIKYGLLGDAVFYTWLREHVGALRARDPQALSYVIEQSCLHKAAIVAADERETGLRALLNLGHSFAHAIECATAYQGWLHGEAVAVGLAMAADLSWRCGWISQDNVHDVVSLLRAFGLPTRPPKQMQVNDFTLHMRRDKKVKDGRLRLVLLEQIGRAVLCEHYADELLAATIANSLTAKEDVD